MRTVNYAAIVLGQACASGDPTVPQRVRQVRREALRTGGHPRGRGL